MVNLHERDVIPTFTDQSHELNIATITDHFFQSLDRIPPNSREVLIGALVDYAEKITPIGYMTVGSQLQQIKKLQPALNRMKKMIGLESQQEKISIDQIALLVQKSFSAHPPSKRELFALKIINYYNDLARLGFLNGETIEEQLLLMKNLKKHLDELQTSYKESLNAL